VAAIQQLVAAAATAWDERLYKTAENRYTCALRACEEVGVPSVHQAMVYMNRAVCRLRIPGREQQMAVKDAERARRMAGHSERAYYNLALTLIKAGDSRIQPDFTWSPPPKNVYGRRARSPRGFGETRRCFADTGRGFVGTGRQFWVETPHTLRPTTVRPTTSGGTIRWGGQQFLPGPLQLSTARAEGGSEQRGEAELGTGAGTARLPPISTPRAGEDNSLAERKWLEDSVKKHEAAVREEYAERKMAEAVAFSSKFAPSRDTGGQYSLSLDLEEEAGDAFLRSQTPDYSDMLTPPVIREKNIKELVRAVYFTVNQLVNLMLCARALHSRHEHAIRAG
jgi:hypothetical protein